MIPNNYYPVVFKDFLRIKSVGNYVVMYAILDDTDLLTKVSDRDVICVANLLNRMKSLVEKRHVEIICLDHIPRNAQFAKAAAAKKGEKQNMGEELLIMNY